MRKSLWVMLVVVVAAIGPLAARADTVTLDVSGSVTADFGGSCSPSPCVLGGDIVLNNTTGTVNSVDFTVAGASPSLGPFNQFIGFDGPASVIFAENPMLNQLLGLQLAGFPNTLVGYSGGSFTVGIVPAVGLTFIFTGTGALTKATVAPEPSSVALLLQGVGLLFVMRKRNSRGHQLAT